MLFTTSTANQKKDTDSQILILPVWSHEKKRASLAITLKHKLSHVEKALNFEDFKGKEGETLLLYDDQVPEKRILLLGLGKEKDIQTERLRRAYCQVTKECLAKKLTVLSLYIPEIPDFHHNDIVRGVAEGLLLPNYSFLRYINKKEQEKFFPIQKIHLLNADKKDVALANKFAKVASAVYLARDLVNSNADDITPQYLGDVAKQLAKKHTHIHTKVMGKKEIQKEKMELILAVNQGSPREPTFIVLEYKGNPKSKESTVIVGKGVTYDTGGLNLKPTGSMETMKCDMAGAAACLGAISAIADLQLKVNVTAVIASTENCIGSHSIKPGDIFGSYLGKTVEINNTDAEGRLILADALAYAEKTLKPTRMIDLATLTGAIDIALGSEAAGIFSANDALADALIRAGSATHERVWRMPVFAEYDEYLKTDIADLKNTGGRPGGAATAAAFLKQFVDKTPWAHLDIASVAYSNEKKRYLPKFASGFGVRLLVEFFENL